MTTTPVLDVSQLQNSLTVANVGKVGATGDFQSVWDSQKQVTANDSKQDSEVPVGKKPGESLKARDAHRARTEKREPDRNVEERTDISEEQLEEQMAVVQTAVAELIQDVADAFDVVPGDVMDKMEDLGLEPVEILDTQSLKNLILQMEEGTKETDLITDETLYGKFTDLIGKQENVNETLAHELGISEGELMDTIKDAAATLQNLQTETQVATTVADKTEPLIEVVSNIASEQIKDDEGTESKVQMTDKADVTTEEMATTATTTETKPVSKDEGTEKQNTGNREKNSAEPNPFLQNLKGDYQLNQTQIQTEPLTSFDEQSQNIMRQIMDYMKINLKEDMSSMEMQLHPASLGTLQINLTSKAGAVTANFVTQNEAVKAALETQITQLKEQFAEQGLKVESIEVSVQTGSFEQNLDQNRQSNREQKNSPRTARLRRIDLNAVSYEEATTDEKIVKDMMIANGNTVDYTA